MIELKSCPFCGGEPELRRVYIPREWLYEARCPECGCGTDCRDTEESAAAGWNLRHCETERAK